MYENPETPASSITELLKYLRDSAASSSGRVYAYRGQHKEYDLPLVPSLYRSFLDPRFLNVTVPDAPPGFSRHVARIYIPENASELLEFLFKKKVLPHLGVKEQEINEHLLPFVEATYDSRWVEEFKRLSGVFEHDALKTVDEVEFSRDKFGCIDLFHRVLMQHIAADLPYGSPYADFLCQQYGVTSGFLDASLSPDVAAFFATHGAPTYQHPLSQGIGVLYRFDITSFKGVVGLSTPPYLVGEDLFSRFEHSSTKAIDVKDSLEDFHQDVLCSNPRNLDLLVVSEGSLRMSRIGRQGSVMLSPATVKEKEGGPTIGIENLRHRPGAMAFYFQHRGVYDRALGIHRNHLWPFIGDVYKHWIAFPLLLDRVELTSFYGGEMVKMPKRVDLIDPGYAVSNDVGLDLACLTVEGKAKNQGIGDKGNTRAERLGLVVQSVNELLEDKRRLTIGTGDTTMDLGQDSFMLFAIKGLLDNEVGFLEEIVNSRRPSDQRLKAAALFCLGVIYMRVGQKTSIEHDPDGTSLWLRHVRTSAFVSDLFHDVENALGTYANLASMCANRVLNYSRIDARRIVSASEFCLDVLDELVALVRWWNSSDLSEKTLKESGRAVARAAQAAGLDVSPGRWASLDL
jgi:hypothetical protein